MRRSQLVSPYAMRHVMGRGDDKHLGWWTPVVMMAIAVAAFIAQSIWPSFPEICPAEEATKLALCAREWMGVAGSYFAVAFAGITIIYLYRQNNEQKKQTDFLLGESRPSIDALQHLHRKDEVIIRIVNWNRRPIVVRKIGIPGLDAEIGLKKTSIKDRETKENLKIRRLDEDGSFDPPIAMHGWKNRSVAPCELRIDILGCKPNTPNKEDWAGLSVSIEVLVAGEDGYFATLISPIAVVG